MSFLVLRAWEILKSVFLGHSCCHAPAMRQYLCGNEQTGKMHLRRGAVVCQQLHQLHTAENVCGMVLLEKYPLWRISLMVSIALGGGFHAGIPLCSSAVPAAGDAPDPRC